MISSFNNLSQENKYILLGVVLANFPDIDAFFTPLYGWSKFHRTITHSIGGNAIIIPILAYLSQKILGLNGFRSYLHCCLLVASCIGSHILTDYITNYGTSLYYPFNKKPVSAGTITVMDFTTILYFYTTYFVSRSGYISQSRVGLYSLVGFGLLMLWKRSMLVDVQDKCFYMIQHLKKKYKTTTVWLQPSNIFNGQYAIMKFDEKTKHTSMVKVVYASQVLSLINYILDLFSLRKIDIRKIRGKHDSLDVDSCAPRGYLINLYRENKPIFMLLAKHTIPSAVLIASFNLVNFYLLAK